MQGPIFLGRYTPEAVGDYMAGPNNLPTGGTAKFYSPLSVEHFLRNLIISMSRKGLRRLARVCLIGTIGGLLLQKFVTLDLMGGSKPNFHRV